MSGDEERKNFYKELKETLSSTKYSVWAKDFPHLDAEAPGYKFWSQKNRWIQRLCELNGKDASDLNPFAVELCPYHSKKWDGTFINDEVRECISQWVLKPALAAIKQSQLPFALAIGKPCYTELKNNFGFKKVKDLGPESNSWPLNAKGKKTNRYFAILEKDGLKVLCTWCKGGTNSAPAESFIKIEESLLKI